MDNKYPQRLFRKRHEIQTHQIKNSCNMSYLDHIKKALPKEYTIVLKHEVFGPILELHDNNLWYSGRLVDTMLTRQLVTKTEHALWFVFGNKPLRFSMQEFHAVTGLKYKDDFSSDLNDWIDDGGGFWSKVLKTHDKVTLNKMKKLYLKQAPGWEEPDKLRMVYLAVIAAILFGYSKEKVIPTEYIKLLMDKQKVWASHFTNILHLSNIVTLLSFIHF